MLIVDSGNHRVVKWRQGALEGEVVAGGHGQGAALNQLRWPSGLSVARDGALFIADRRNHRVVRWRKGAAEGEGGRAGAPSGPVASKY